MSTPCEIASAARAGVGSRECVPRCNRNPVLMQALRRACARTRTNTSTLVREQVGVRVALNCAAVGTSMPAGMLHVACLMHAARCMVYASWHVARCTCDVTDRCRCMPLSPKSTCGTWCASTRADVPGLLFVRLVPFGCLFACLPVLCFAALRARVCARALLVSVSFPHCCPERVRPFVRSFRSFVLHVCLFYMFVCLFAWLRALAVRPAAALRLCGSATNAL